MAFRFVLGRAGSGKTTWCLQEIKRRLAERPDGRPLIWLVPEQATSQAEYALIQSPELGGTLRAQVLSFRRLAWRVMQEVGGTARLPIDETGKKLLLHSILHKQKDRLRLFDASADQMGFLDNLNQLLTEFKRYCVTSDGLKQYIEQQETREGLGGRHLRDKLHDLQLVYGEFERQLSRQYLDGEDYLALLARQLKDSSYVLGAECWIDGFHGFTPQEMTVVEQLAVHCENVSLTLCLNREYRDGEEPHELDLFHPTARTMMNLHARLQELGTRMESSVLLDSEPPARFADSPALAYLETAWEQRVKRPYSASFEERSKPFPVRLSAAVSRRAEAESVARDIVRLVREDGLRYRDIAVSVRNIEAYGDLLAGTFQDYGIPHFFDQKRTVMHHPVVELIRSSLEVIQLYWKYDAVFRCVKTDFFLPLGKDASEEVVIDRHAMDQLENYVLAFGIQGSKWLSPDDWTYCLRADLDSDGTKGSAGEEAFLRKINACRRRVTGPLLRMQEKMKTSKRVRDRVEALYELLVTLQVPERLEAWSQEALRQGKPEKAREHAQVWDRVMDMLDQLVELMGEESLSTEVFARLVETGMESMKLGLVPPTLDQVLVGSMDRTRSGQVKIMFVLGVNEGVMPAKITENGVVSEQERELLAASGLMLAESSRRRLLDEPFLMYCAFCTPSHGLWLSYPLADEEGKTLLPSDVIRQIKRMFPMVKERLLVIEPGEEDSLTEHLSFVAHPDKALSLLIMQLKRWMYGEQVNEVWWSVYNWFARQPEYSGRLSRLLQSLLYTNEEAPLREETSRELYGETIETSVSRMERFVQCPFSQFVSHGLRLKERQLFRLEAPDIGQLFHSALSGFAEQVLQEGVDWGGLSARECEERAALVIDMLAPRLQGEILLSSKRYHYIARKLKQVIGKAAAILGEHERRGQFRPIGLEVGFGKGQPIPPLEYELPGGVKMELRGRIDRIDRADTERGTLLRVIDYKSSSKALNLAEVYHGLSLQMLAYLDVVLTHAPIWLGKEAEPAGVLYFHVHNPVLNQKNRLEAEAVEKEVKKRFKMKGLLRADAEIVKLMDNGLASSSGYSEILPAALKTDGTFYKTSSVATEAQWNTVRSYVKKTIQSIGTSITEGRIDIAPYRMGPSAACNGCSYRPVCQFDTQFEGNAHRQLPMLGKDRVWELMESPAAGQVKPIPSSPRFRPAGRAEDKLAALQVTIEDEDQAKEGGDAP